LERVNKILNNPKYQEYLKLNEEYEVDRKFCRHDLSHFLDVARIAYILVLEEKLNVSKEIVYAAALLHDIGRWLQYSEGKAHDEGSADLAAEMLDQSGFDSLEKKVILDAIRNHRNEGTGEESFGSIFYRSDKLSRNCFNCGAAAECNWKDEKKNFTLKY
jgi:putative nucleotidyltransferase with HDIG domain